MMSLLTACYYDSEEYLYPQLGNPCDTTNVTYSLSVEPILENNCYGCHSNSNAAFGGNIRLEDYPDVLIKALDGSLLGAISHISGYTPMPLGTARMEECKITTIRVWIQAGSPDN
jgi:hypothetical protein